MSSHRFTIVLFLSLFFVSPLPATVEPKGDGLYLDGQKAPFLFGAEVQYFRARGGPGKNIPKAAVVALWNRILDRVVEAKMNTVIFYIPWDFHEPQEGVFDFKGTLDLDQDGNPDYPSRDLDLFFRLIQEHGIKNIMVRPGPYINAEWGPVGFGAIPRWFLENHADALTGSKTEGRPRTASFGHPTYRAKVERWFAELHSKVLKNWVGPGKPVKFLQIDNETNFFWDSLYERDYSAVSLQRYRAFLQTQYTGSIEKLNLAYSAKLSSFADAEPPRASDDHRFTAAWHYDWFLFHDVEIADYYQFLKRTWNTLGITEPEVLFTSCDSFNAMENGLLPRLDLRQKDQLTLTTMNVYPKTYGTQEESTLNVPMKAAHDATLVAASHRQVYGSLDQWVWSSETVGGWFPPTKVSLATRQHTYGSLLGSGVKAMTIYYFHEGWNWNGSETKDSELHFNAPLDKNGQRRKSFSLLKKLGADLANGLGQLVNDSVEVAAPILIAHDHTTQYPIPGATSALFTASEDSAGLYGFLRESGYLPQLAFLNEMPAAELKSYRAVFIKNPGYLYPQSQAKLQRYAEEGGTLIVIGKNPFEASERIIALPEDPSKGWNTDGYPVMPTAQASLKKIKALLLNLGIQPLMQLETSDAEPFLHTWVRRPAAGKGASLLFAENFSRASRRFQLKLAPEILPEGETFRFEPLHELRETKFEPVTASRKDLTETGVWFPVAPDNVEIWQIKTP